MHAHQPNKSMNPQFDKNEDEYKLLRDKFRAKIEKIKLGGGKKALDKQHEKGKLTARERIAFLLDTDQPQVELGSFAGYEMYAEHGGCPAGGVVVVIGFVSGRQCVVVANDATVKAGAWFPITGKKNLRAQEIALENRLPIIYLVDSAGVYLPLQDEIFPDKENFGRIFRNNAQLSAEGITQIAAVMGSCVAGGAYLPIMSDESMIVEGTGSIFLAGPYLVKAAIGEDIDAETLGGATTQTEISGVIDHKFKDDRSCLNGIKDIMGKLGDKPKAGFNRTKSRPPARPATDIYGILPTSGAPYDTYQLLNCIIDEGEFTEFKPSYGKSLVCAYARIDGWAVGIVTNQRKVVKSAKGEMQFGGVIYSDSADKAARFIMNCNQKHIPLVFLQDVTGFMVGSRSEHGGIIKDGAKLVNAVANSIVPKFTVIMGSSYGAGNYALCGKAYDPRLIVAYPASKMAVMGGEQAAKVLLQIEISSLKAKGETITPEREQEILKNITEKYQTQTKPEYAAARLWTDEIIDPAETRTVLSLGIQAANNAPITKAFKMGVMQT